MVNAKNFAYNRMATKYTQFLYISILITIKKKIKKLFKIKYKYAKLLFLSQFNVFSGTSSF